MSLSISRLDAILDAVLSEGLVGEARIKIKSPSYNLGRDIAVLENPSPVAVLMALDRVNKKGGGETLAGWLTADGVWIWEREDADHFYVAREARIKTGGDNFAIYIKPEETIDGHVVEATFEISDFSSGSETDYQSLLSNPFVTSIENALLERRSELGEVEQDDDFSDILNSLGGSDY